MALNRAIIMGNLGQDPELRYTQSGAAVCTFSLATTEYRTDKEGNRQEATEWHRIVVWNKQAENCSKYLAKGRTALVEGRIQTRSWEDQSGQKRYTTEIVAQNVQFVGGNRDASGGSYQQRDGGGASQGGGYQSGGQPSYNQGMGGGPIDNGPNLDEIPF